MPNTLITISNPRSPIAEAYRALRTNLEFSNLDKSLRSLLVTSASAEEGKSTTLANLAVTIAQSGKRVILVDDSIVRGTTSVKIVQMIREAGAREVHIRVASPMIFYPDFYGIDTPDAEKLLANQYGSLKAMCDFIGADSLEFLSIDGLYRSVGGEPRDNAQPQFTDHYFTGDYPTRLLDRESTSNVRKLSMLASNG